MRHASLRPFACLLLVGLGCASCGGGGGGGGDQPHLFAGEYVYVQTTGPVSGTALRGEVGTASADGVGTLTFLEAYAADEGTLTGPFVPPARSFRVSAARDLTLTDPADLEVGGRIAGDGSVAAVTNRTSPTLPAFLLLARRASAPTQASLAGSWHYVRFGRSAAVGKMAMSATATIGVDPAGSVAFSNHESNTDGVIPTIVSPFLPSKITPAAGGWLTWTNASATEVWFRGGLSGDGNLMLFVSREDSGRRAVVRVLLRHGQATSTADLVGEYGWAGAAGYHDKPAWGTSFGTWVLNGTGAGTLTLSGVLLGAQEGPDTMPASYGVGPTGLLDGSLLGTLPFVGGVGTAAQYAVIGGVFHDNAPPWLVVLIR